MTYEQGTARVLARFWGRGPKTQTRLPCPFLPLKNHSRPVGVMAIVAGRHNPLPPKFQAHSTTLRAERMSPHGS